MRRDFARGRLQPILDVNGRSGDILKKPWIDEFAAAMALHPESWQALAKGANVDIDATDAVASLSELIALAHGESELDTSAVNALVATAPADLAAAVLRLWAARQR